jgi:probable 2-oxoglutarate dehydrogenase E1 component DHKTD1
MNCCSKAASSFLSEFEPQTRFKPILDDPHANSTLVKRLVLLSGKIYYDLVKERASRKHEDGVAFVRIEELSPFPFLELRETLARYSEAAEVYWLQEEPSNQGAYPRVSSQIESVMVDLGLVRRLAYRGRPANALPATGIGRLYAAQQKAIIDAAFEGL